MAEIYRPILALREIVKTVGVDLGEYRPPKKTIRRFVHIMCTVEDVRRAGLISYPLSHILVMAFLAVMAGANTWIEIEGFTKVRSKWLGKIIPLEHGTPSHDTFRRVLSLVDPGQLGKATTTFLMERMGKIKKALNVERKAPQQICLDGKEAKGTGRKYGTSEKIPNLQTLHVYNASYGICLASVPIKEKTNEIPTAQEVLKEMQLKDTIVTFDAMNTQKDTIAIIASKEKGGDYIGGLKGNHPTMLEEIALYFSDARLDRIRTKGTHYYFIQEKAHNRIEKRSYFLTDNIDWFEDKALWTKLRAFVCYSCETEDLVSHEHTFERRYYITSLKDVRLCADAIRGHWAVENQLHWQLDTTFLEDDNTTTDKNAFNNLSILNKLALTLYKLVQPTTKNTSIKVIRKQFGWSFDEQFSSLLNLFDEDFLSKVMLSVKK